MRFHITPNTTPRHTMIRSAIETIRNVWDTFLGKVAILSLCVGWMPIVALNYAREAIEAIEVLSR